MQSVVLEKTQSTEFGSQTLKQMTIYGMRTREEILSLRLIVVTSLLYVAGMRSVLVGDSTTGSTIPSSELGVEDYSWALHSNEE